MTFIRKSSLVSIGANENVYKSKRDKLNSFNSLAIVLWEVLKNSC